MWEFIQNNAAEIISYVAIVTTISPFLISRVVSDKNILTKFTNIKTMAQNINFKEIDINESLVKIDQVTSSLSKEIKEIKLTNEENIKRINATILEFTESDIYTKMLLGLEQLDQLNQVLQNKDETISDLKAIIKEINLKLGVMENDRRI